MDVTELMIWRRVCAPAKFRWRNREAVESGRSVIAHVVSVKAEEAAGGRRRWAPAAAAEPEVIKKGKKEDDAAAAAEAKKGPSEG